MGLSTSSRPSRRFAPRKIGWSGCAIPRTPGRYRWGELTGLIEDAGLEATVRAERDRPVLIERWLSLTSTPADIGEAIRAELTAELDGGAPTGMRPHLRHGELYQTQRWAIVVGQKHA